MGPQAIKAPAVMGVFVAKPITLMKEKTAYIMNNQRIVLLSEEEEKRGATHNAANEEKKPHPNISSANITEPVEYGRKRVKSVGTSGKLC